AICRRAEHGNAIAFTHKQCALVRRDRQGPEAGMDQTLDNLHLVFEQFDHARDYTRGSKEACGMHRLELHRLLGADLRSATTQIRCAYRMQHERARLARPVMKEGGHRLAEPVTEKCVCMGFRGY